MPIYEYQCQDCKTSFETIVSSFTRVEEVICKKCGSSNVKKAMSATCKVSGSSVSSAPSMGGCGGGSGFS